MAQRSQALERQVSAERLGPARTERVAWAARATPAQGVRQGEAVALALQEALALPVGAPQVAPAAEAAKVAALAAAQAVQPEPEPSTAE